MSGKKITLATQLFNATSVREATKGTHINEYILVFTVMTVLYLPLTFVSVGGISQGQRRNAVVIVPDVADENRDTQTLYGVALFDFEQPSQTMSFAVSTVVISVGTYIASAALLYGVRQRRYHGSLRKPIARAWSVTADTIKRAFTFMEDLLKRDHARQQDNESEQP
jgi:hypothetical protein